MPFAEIIRGRTQGDPVLQKATEHILKSTERGKVITEDILRFTRATGELELKPLDASQLLADVSDELRSRLDNATSLAFFCEEGLHLTGDAARLQQVVVNLAINARDAMPSGGMISVRLVSCPPETYERFETGAGTFENYAHLTVSDEGQGIPPHVIGHIFEPLFTTKGSRGTGLGLAIVHQIVAAHGGQIDVDSVPGRGTTFHLLLRKSRPETTTATRVEEVDGTWSSIRSVVLVEDELSVGEGLSQLLDMEGVHCEWVTRGDTALDRLRSNPPDLLILDVGLPDMSGVEVYREVAKWYPDLPTIFSTGHGDHRLLEEFDQPSPVGFLSKPYGLEELTRKVQSLLHDRGPGRDSAVDLKI
ncbi:MAG TPA: ATP-binding protein [Thermoanaerobaculia bacterium]|nr:ATP-binding protein [Thermoanaerobaculia bacterium]